MNSRARVASQRHFLEHRISADLVLVMLIVVFLVVPAFGQDGDDESPVTVGPITGAQTMWSLANENRPDTRASIPQFMLAFVERNPDAFIAGNVNLLREGVILEVPTVEEALAISRAEATRRLDEQMEWFSRLSREERMALRDTAEGELPPVIEDPEPAVEPEEVAPDPEAVLEPEEAMIEPEAEPESEPPQILEPEPAPDPERLDIVPEPEPIPETDVTIVDEVQEPDPLFDPAPAEPEEEVLPEAPDRMPDPMPEPDLPDHPAEQPHDMPTPAVADPDTPATTEPAPPVIPGPGPEPGWMDRVSWWMWAGPALVLLLGMLLILRIIGRRREAVLLESESPTDTPEQAKTGSSAAAVIPASRVEPDEEDASETSMDVAEDDSESSNDDADSPWASFEDSVMGSEPDVEARTAVLDGAHPAERAGEEEGDQEGIDQDEPEFDWLELDDEQPQPRVASVSEAESEPEVAEDPEPREQTSASAKEDRDPGEESPSDVDDEFDISDFPMASSDASAVAAEQDEPVVADEEPEAPGEEPEFDLTNFDFDDTVAGDGDRTVLQDEDSVDDDIDDSVPEKSGKGLDDLDEIMSRDLKGAGLLEGEVEEERTDIAPPLDAPDSPADAAPEADETSDQDEATGDQSRLNDQEAEVMIDLARLTAEGGDEQYARDLLAEVIRDGSKKMAEAARKLQASLR